MVKLASLENSYVNLSGKVYDSEFINLAQIANNAIHFDQRTLFLSEHEKQELNQQPLAVHHGGVYILEQHGILGLVCDLPICEYQRQHVRNHELVLPDTIQGMLSNYRGYNAEAAPVLLMANTDLHLAAFVASHAPSAVYQAKEIRVLYYGESDAALLLDQFSSIDHLYVGDGHHRLYATSLSGFKQNILAYIVDFNDIRINPIHRELIRIGDDRFAASLRFIQKKFQVTLLSEDNPAPVNGSVIMMRGTQAWRIQLIGLDADGFWNNDIYRLNTQIIQQAFRIFDGQRQVHYLNEEEFQRHRKNKDAVFFKVHAMSKTDFLKSAADNNILPPKSTWMFPKAPSMLIMSRYQ